MTVYSPPGGSLPSIDFAVPGVAWGDPALIGASGKAVQSDATISKNALTSALSGIYVLTAATGPSAIAAASPVLTITENITSAGAGSANYPPLKVAATYLATDPASPFNLAYLGIYSALAVGSAGTAAVGTTQAVTATIDVVNSGNVQNEQAVYMGWLRYDTGTVGRAWFCDFSVQGPVNTQPNKLDGITMFVNNYYNGSPSASPAAGLWVVTLPGGGAGGLAEHSAATTYPLDVGIGIVGFGGTGAASTNGYTIGLQVGGRGSGWMGTGARSKVATGISIQDLTATGISFSNAQASGLTGILWADNVGGYNWLIDASARTSAFANGAILLPGGNTKANGSITWGSDANNGSIYRLADQVLGTDVNFAVSGNLLVGTQTSTAKLKVVNGTQTIPVGLFRIVAGQTANILQVEAVPGGTAMTAFALDSGYKLQWADPSVSTNVVDTNLYRGGVGQLQTDNTIVLNAAATGSTAAMIFKWGGTEFYRIRNSAGGTVPVIDIAAGKAYNFGGSGSLTIGVQVTVNDAFNIALGTATGTKIGTATNQKLGFYNSAPIVQPSAVGSATGYTTGATVAVFHSDDTYTGNTGSTAYTINGIVAALKNLGLVAA